MTAENAPRIFYFCYDHNRPTGGQKETYQHVDILNKCGFLAYALHTKEGFRLAWFENETRTIGQKGFEAIFDARRDYVVLPEDLGLKTSLFPGRKVIFNKNLYEGFATVGTECPAQYPALAPDVVAILAVSQHNQRHLQFAYPSLEVLRVDVDVRPQIFRYCSLSDKQPIVACIQKTPNHLYTLYHMIKSRAVSNLNMAGRFAWTFLRNLTELQVADTLRRSLIFVFLSVDEGFPRMPLEAMACGCIVASYGHGPLREYLPKAYQFEHSDLVSIASFIETIMESFPNRLEKYQDEVSLGRKIALSHAAAQQERSVLKAWEKILSRSSRIT